MHERSHRKIALFAGKQEPPDAERHVRKPASLAGCGVGGGTREGTLYPISLLIAP